MSTLPNSTRKNRVRTEAPATISPPTTMTFRVGPFDYVVKVVATAPRMDGVPCDGIIEFDEERIQLYAKTRGKRRLNVLLHELAHAWRYHFPAPCDEESQCDFLANLAQSAMQDLLRQGGIEALEAMQPTEEPMAAIGGAA